ncbi:hypothetical protein TOPH_06596 [Tolypocladium ophioglossoides CBS 100239]|uniref:Uncharacterized protein n=1 Tax=Tolypocladium ophioglossoides (strain CBS 100239) TaxID=1163406 RepID=A0A0L0N4M5_TOLOC|nr:hypothetical protein TOPH_06596 [Tolypocladium ophioglossoides CBS 100239]
MERGVRKLDLSNCGPGFVADRVGVVPGLRSSADITAFFTFLRANLVLTPSAVSSTTNTPYLEPYSPQPYLAPSSPSPPSPLAANPPLTPLDDIPPLSLDTLSTRDDKTEGLRLVADSLAQMESRAARTLALHPLCLAALAAAWGLVYRCAYLPKASGDAGRAILLACGVAVAYLLAIRYRAAGYVTLAEDITWSWLKPDYSCGEQDIMLGARYGNVLIGVLVLRLEPKCGAAGPGPSPRRKNRSRSASLRGGKGLIRAWTTRLKYRGRGVGRDLLLAAVRTTKEQCGKDAQVGFAREHANSTMLLPPVFNGAFRRDENRAANALEDAVAVWEASKKKRR